MASTFTLLTSKSLEDVPVEVATSQFESELMRYANMIATSLTAISYRGTIVFEIQEKQKRVWQALVSFADTNPAGSWSYKHTL